jgi:hypothetical protein
VAGEAPEVRAVVDVERGARAVLAGEAQRLQDRRLGARVRQMRAGGDDGAGPAISAGSMSSSQSAMSAQFSR